MKLSAYLKENKHTQKTFIEEVEMATNSKIPQSTLAKWILGIRIPRKDEMLLLYDVTGGKVQPNDFYGIEVPHNNESWNSR